MKQKIFMKTLFILLFLSLTFFSCNSDDNSENSDRTTITINTTINGNNYSGLRVLIDGDEENSDTAYDNEYYEAETNNNGKVIFENVLMVNIF